MELGSEYVQVQLQNVITVVEADDAVTSYTISPKRKMLKCLWRIYNIIYSPSIHIIGQSQPRFYVENCAQRFLLALTLSRR